MRWMRVCLQELAAAEKHADQGAGAKSAVCVGTTAEDEGTPPAKRRRGAAQPSTDGGSLHPPSTAWSVRGGDGDDDRESEEEESMRAGGGSLRVQALKLLQFQHWVDCVHMLQQAHHQQATAKPCPTTTTTTPTPTSTPPHHHTQPRPPNHHHITPPHHTSTTWVNSREALQALVIARTHALSKLQAWSAVLSLTRVGLQEGGTMPVHASVRRAYRQVGE